MGFRINIVPIVRELKDIDLRSFFKNVGKDSVLLHKIDLIEREWRTAVKEIEQISRRVASEGINHSIGAEVNSVINHCEIIAKTAGPLLVEGGSFVPGPVGIVCSLALAIADFAVANYWGGFLNLLGCIPFAKAGCKTVGPMVKKIAADIYPMLKDGINMTRKTRSLSKAKNVTGDIHRQAEKLFTEYFEKEGGKITQTGRILDTGKTYKMELEYLTQGATVPGRANAGSILFQGTQFERRTISNYGIGYGMNPQTIIRLWP